MTLLELRHAVNKAFIDHGNMEVLIELPKDEQTVVKAEADVGANNTWYFFIDTYERKD